MLLASWYKKTAKRGFNTEGVRCPTQPEAQTWHLLGHPLGTRCLLSARVLVCPCMSSSCEVAAACPPRPLPPADRGAEMSLSVSLPPLLGLRTFYFEKASNLHEVARVVFIEVHSCSSLAMLALCHLRACVCHCGLQCEFPKNKGVLLCGHHRVTVWGPAHNLVPLAHCPIWSFHRGLCLPTTHPGHASRSCCLCR